MFPTLPHRLPRAAVDPIGDERTLMAIVRAAAARPPRHETIVMLLDDARCGLALLIVSGTARPDDVIEVAERVLPPDVHEGRAAASAIVSVRLDDGEQLDDADRWIELDAIADGAGVELVDWLIVGGDELAVLGRPRELVHEPARW